MDNLKKILPELMIIAEPPMKEYTSFKVGGTAAFMVLPKNIEELKLVPGIGEKLFAKIKTKVSL